MALMSGALSAGDNYHQFLRYGLSVARSLRQHKACTPPTVVQVEITNLCNLKCVMCDRWTWVRSPGHAGNLSTQKIFSLFSELARMKVKAIELTGGEPLLRNDFRTIIENASSLGLKGMIFTNGTCMDEQNAETLAKADFTVIFSIDGASARTHDLIRGVDGTFDRALRGVRNMLKASRDHGYRNQVRINFTVQKKNLDDMVALFRLADELCVGAVHYNIVGGKPECLPGGNSVGSIRRNLQVISKLAASSRTDVTFARLLRLFIEGKLDTADVKEGLLARNFFAKRPVTCLSVYSSALIDAFGDVYPCCYTYFDNHPYESYQKQRKALLLGSINETSFKEIWYGENYETFRRLVDPVDIGRLGFACGLCEDYFKFRAYGKVLDLFKELGIISTAN